MGGRNNSRQKQLLVIAALTLFAHEFETAEPETAAWAWELAQELANSYDISPEEAVLELEAPPSPR